MKLAQKVLEMIPAEYDFATTVLKKDPTKYDMPKDGLVIVLGDDGDEVNAYVKGKLIGSDKKPDDKPFLIDGVKIDTFSDWGTLAKKHKLKKVYTYDK